MMAGFWTRAWGMMVLLLLAMPVPAFDVLQPLPEQPIIPADNPQTEAKVRLGWQLFFDPRLSRDISVSCNSCHNLAAGGDDDGGATRQPGRFIQRSAPTLWNAAYMSVQFWDGRAKSLEEAFMDHLLDPQILAMPSAEALIQRLLAIPGYRQQLAEVFPGEPASAWQVGKALAAFIRTLKTPNSAFDRYIRGQEDALSPAARRGLDLFNEKGCLACHFGVNFAGPAPGPSFKMGDGFYELFPNYLGTEYDDRYRLTDDVGRVRITRRNDHTFMWRVAPLRNIALTAPYFHNGSVKDLAEAVRIMGKVQFRHELSEQEVQDLVAFLLSLTGEIPEIRLPHLPETPGVSLAP